jgi:hypothetical protein
MGGRHRFRNWRAGRARSRWSRLWRRGLVVPRGRDGRPLSRRERLARWWRIRRRHAPGIIRLRRRVPLRHRIMARVWPRNWRWLARRRRRPPGWLTDRLPSWARWLAPATRRIDRRRTDRWMRNHGTAPAQPQPRPRPARTVHGTGIFGPGPGATTGTAGGGAMPAQIQPAIDEIERLGSWDPDHATDLDGTIRNLSGISGEVANSFHRIGRTLEDSGAHEDFSTILHEAANGIEHHSSELEGHLAGGLMSHTGGNGRGGARSPQVQGVIDTVQDLGGWDPEDPENLDETIQSLAGVIQAVRTSYNQLGQTLAGTGAHSTYPEHLHHAAGGIGSIADEVEQSFHGGVLRRPGS